MKLFYTLLWFCSSLTLLLAYPMDYNETNTEITREALNNLVTLLSQDNFSGLLQEYNDDISLKNKVIIEKINSICDTFSQHLNEIEESASNVNADVTDCLGNLKVLTPEEYYEKYNEDCVSPARSLGLNIINIGNNKQTVLFTQKYGELMDYFSGCLSDGDPAPRICAGVIEGTLQEVRRILPAVKANPVLIERELKQQILVLSECSNQYITVLNKKLHSEFSKAKTCALNKVNLA